MSPEFEAGRPLIPQQRVGEFVPIRLVDPWVGSEFVQVRWWVHDSEICISHTWRTDDGGEAKAIEEARRYLRDHAEEMKALAEALS
jgi:hypothetical protein